MTRKVNEAEVQGKSQESAARGLRFQEIECGQAEAVVMVSGEGRHPGVVNGVNPIAACYVFYAHARRSSLRWRSPGSSGEGLAPEPWQLIFHTCLPRLKRWRKSPAEGVILPSSPSVKSPTVRRCKVDLKLLRRPAQCQVSLGSQRPLKHRSGCQETDVVGAPWVLRPPGKRYVDMSSQTERLPSRLIEKNLCPSNRVQFTPR
jgi:hypothetical protein